MTKERSVMVVEDDDDLREGLEALLRRKGYTVHAFANGEDALDHLRAGGGACVVLLDLMMPVMTGWEMRAELLKDSRFASIPVVIVSGVRDLDDASRGMNVAATLSKPIPLPRLYALLQEHCPC